MNILVACDSAFNFTYRANIDALRLLGNVSFFSPLSDSLLPPCDLLYLPGGYPELFLTEIAENVGMRTQIRDYAENGGHVFAECGGFMYLCSDIDGQPMCGVLPFSATMSGAHLHLGYRQMEWGEEGEQRLLVKGHEFHYSAIADSECPHAGAIETLHIQSSATGRHVDTPVYRYKNVIAGYTHWYWADKTLDELRILFGMDKMQHATDEKQLAKSGGNSW